MKNADNFPVMSFETPAAWEAWLNEHHENSGGVWLKIAKKDSRLPSVTYDEAVDSALCHGWIDGQKAPFDDKHWLQKFTPRRPKSAWSKKNCERADALMSAGRMRPAGMRQVEQAKVDGRWELAYEPQSRITIPEDFQRELDKNRQAQAFFSTLNSVNRYAVLYRIQIAKKPETRAALIRKYIEMLSNHQKLHP